MKQYSQKINCQQRMQPTTITTQIRKNNPKIEKGYVTLNKEANSTIIRL